jgi:hypothetical protein
MVVSLVGTTRFLGERQKAGNHGLKDRGTLQQM